MISRLDVVANLNLIAASVPSYLARDIREDAGDSLSIGFQLISFFGDSDLLTGRSALAEINQPDSDPNAAVKQTG